MHAVKNNLCTADCDPDLTVVLTDQSEQSHCLGISLFVNPGNLAEEGGLRDNNKACGVRK